ncbi:MAG TPA: class I SAM-dependent methyltransferase [Candidatus Binatia bacterium]|nr:class I SAM-dependent methyltransferase [Candidatus Binatia bacterium]
MLRRLTVIKLLVAGLLAANALLILPGAPVAQELSKLPYVPTPQVVVDERLKLANVTAKDFVIDLGSGDGRMIITAAQKFKASGLGVDIDAKLVERANQNAKAEGVADRVKFIEQDMFKADISRATVVTLYVIPDFIEKLRPKLLAELKPGTRIVSHDYYMRGWYPDRQFSLTVPEKIAANGTDKAYLYLWIVPSVVAGNWRVELDPGGANRQLIAMAIDQEYQVLNASAENIAGPLKIDNARLRGDEISFDVTIGSSPYRFTGKVSDGKMDGTAVTPGGKQPIPWRAGKVPDRSK